MVITYSITKKDLFKHLSHNQIDFIITGFQHLQLNKSSKYRRNAVFFCQIPLSFTLYMLYNYGGLYLIWR